MSGTGRELVVLGTSAQTPTRERNHNGYVLRWDDEAILFDPGEGAQRQLLLAGVSWASITAICITHFSPRYPDIAPLADEARHVFPDVAAVRDFDRVAVPPRLHGSRAEAS